MKRVELAPRWCGSALAFAAAAMVVSCYDTPLIPDDAAGPILGGGKGTGGSALGGGGRAASAAGSSDGGDDSAAGSGNGNGNGGAQSAAGSGGSAGASAGSANEAGQAGATSMPGVTWIELSGSQAPDSDVNRELGIQGAFYAYSDGCAEVTWDEASRCASGKLCDPTLHADAWGMAIGFDFHTSGGAKLTWNPDDVGALGLSWVVTGSAPGLQLWVLNMAPSWQGRCDVMTCEIEGPPDGLAEAPRKGQLYFDDMTKDYWGGAGIDYQFDPAAVHALQFKLPAIRVHDASFDFCVEALGVIR